jgi:hypothetical protein
MSSFGTSKVALASGILAAAAWAVSTPPVAQQRAAPPNFSDEPGVAWLAVGGGGGGFAPVPGRVPPLAADPAHPYVANNNSEGRQPTDRIADLSNPNLKPRAKEVMRKDIEEVLAGKKIAFTPRSSCMPSGVPAFMAYGGGAFATYFLQTPKEVWIIFSGEDPDTYYEAWSGVRRYRRVRQDYVERSCAENPQQLVDWHIPVASKPDF